MKSKAFKIIQISISVFILAILIVQLNVSDFSDIHFNLSPLLGFSVLLFLFLALVSRSLRWAYLMNNDAIKISQWNSFKFLLVGSALNIVMPAGAGDVAKGYFGYKWSGIKERMFSVSLYDKLIAIASLSVLSVYAYYVTYDFMVIVAGVLSIVPLLMVKMYYPVTSVAFVKKLVQYVQLRVKKISIDDFVRNLQFPAQKSIISIIISVVSWLLTYTLLYLCFRLVQLDISVSTVIAMSPILTLARLFPLTFNGLGSDELLMVYLFGQSGAPEEGILAGALLYRLILIFVPAIFGIIIINSTKSLEHK